MKRLRRVAVLAATLVLAGAGLVGAEAAAAPVAIVAALSGSGTLHASGASAELRLFDRLAVGDVVSLAADATAVVAFVNGNRFEVQGGGTVTVGQVELQTERGVVNALKPVGTVPAVAAIPAAHSPGRRSGAIRVRSGSLWGAEVENLYPRDGAASLACATKLTFTSVVSATEYRVDVEDELGETVFQAETRSPEVIIPGGVLKPDTEYYWRVRTVGRRLDGGRGEALFVTLSAENAAAREAIRQRVEAEGGDGALLLLAEVDRSLGLYREACETLVRAGAGDPTNPHIEAARRAFLCSEYAID